jgi:hypothetical protein
MGGAASKTAAALALAAVFVSLGTGPAAATGPGAAPAVDPSSGHGAPSPGWGSEGLAGGVEADVAAGRRIYRDGVLPSGEPMTGFVQGDIALTGEQVTCGWCHRRSGLGASEGQDVVPAVTADILYTPLRLPTSKPPLAPEQRPAYTDDTLKRAIRDGIGADGEPFDPLMPRYPLDDAELDLLLAYLKTLTTAPDPGVDAQDIHFATIVSDGVDAATRDAVLAVYDKFFEQKNVETRNESRRAAHAPRHKAWVFGPYRKWVLHVWRLEGPPESWPAQLAARYAEQPVFAVIGGLVDGPWRPVHDFCESQQLPCLFPRTDLPVVDEPGFYSAYLSRGMFLEADIVRRHLAEAAREPIVQVYRLDDPRSVAAAARLRGRAAASGTAVTDIGVADAATADAAFWRSVAAQTGDGTLVAWLGPAALDGLWTSASLARIRRIYLSTTLYGHAPGALPNSARERVFLVHPYALPASVPRLLIRATGWFRAKRIDAPDARREQADAFFALKMTGAALRAMRGFFVREYLLEKLEHMTENASYTSVYSHVALAPGQRFASQGAYITRFDPSGSDALVAVTDWLIPRAD